MAVETPREFGDELRRERELRDVTREQLALVTKVSVRQIEALEKGRFEILPALVFSRGFVRSIALHLGLDAERTVAAYRHVWEHWESGRSEEAPARGPLRPRGALQAGAPRRTVAASTTIRAVAVAAALAVVTGIAVLVKSRPTEPRRAAAAPARPESGPASLALPPSVAAATVALPADAPPPGRTPAGSSAAERPGPSTLSLSFRDDCWTEVRVDGKVVARELFPKGATREFTGGRTFTLTLGNAGAVEVTLDGKTLPPVGGQGEVVKNRVIEPPPGGSGG
jgi:cytoskeleton protein RodZ